jgi:aflatoxin B1 aldehyde reductase
MTFGPEGTGGARIYDTSAVGDVLDTFKKFGHDELDTARAYCGGEEEKFIAEVGFKKRGLKLASKAFPVSPGAHNAERLRATLETSLKELNTDKVDLYYLHAPDWDTPLEETLRTMNELHKEGKVEEWGLSNFAV